MKSRAGNAFLLVIQTDATQVYMGELEQHLIDDLLGADRAAYWRQFGIRWVPADEMVLVKALELVVADADRRRRVVHVRLGDHRRHGGVDVPGFELISAMRLPKGDEIVVGHEPVLSECGLVVSHRKRATWRATGADRAVDHSRLGLTAWFFSVRLFDHDLFSRRRRRPRGLRGKNPLPIILPISRNPLFFYGQVGIMGITSYYKKI